MFKRVYTVSLIHPNVTGLKIIARHSSFRKFQLACKKFWKPRPLEPPYTHICQIGDPVLRKPAVPVDPNSITSDNFQRLLQYLRKMMKSYGAVGLAAPQIGLPWQVIMLEQSEKELEKIDKKIITVREMEAIPYKVFINPTFKVTDYTILQFPESCVSIRGFTAHVPRVRGVQVTGLDSTGKLHTWDAKGWSARVVQHELDHLQGKVYTDRMDPSTFECSAWEKINRNYGMVELRYGPK